MQGRKKYVKLLVLAGVMMIAVMGCDSQEKNTDSATENMPQTSSETQDILEKVTYTSSDGSVSIILPDSKWQNTLDSEGKLSFVSEGEGEITIDYADSKKAVGKLAFASTEKKLAARLKKLGMNTDNLEISNYSFDKSTGIKVCSYSLRYKEMADGNFYTVTTVSAVSERGYQVSGNVKKEDTALLASVQESIKSFLVLKNPLTAEPDAEESGSTSEGSSAPEGSSEGNSSASDEERYFFDEPGNTIYVTQNPDGVWVDKNGRAYMFYETGVEDYEGNQYYYDPPEFRTGGSGSASDSNSSSGTDGEADYY
nr:hypothetical protein [Lachnospiraceae bacterium]